LQEGVIGEVVLPEYAVLNRDALQLWQAEQVIKLFDVSARLFLGMKLERVPQRLGRELINPPVLSEAQGMKLVEVILTEPLRLVLRRTKRAMLSGGNCRVFRMKIDAKSLNHAYTLASMRYEPDRISHTGSHALHPPGCVRFPSPQSPRCPGMPNLSPTPRFHSVDDTLVYRL